MASLVHDPGGSTSVLPAQFPDSPPQAESVDQAKRRRIGEVIGASNGAWLKSLRLQGVSRVAGLKRVQTKLRETGMEPPVDKDLHKSNIFPFTLFTSKEAEELTTITKQELASDMPNREKAGVITDGPFHRKGLGKYAQKLRSRRQQPLNHSSTLQCAVIKRITTLLQ